MRGAIFKEMILLVAAGAAMWGGLVALDLGPDESDFELSIESEDKLGTLLVEHVTRAHPEVNTALLDSSLATIVDRLLAQVPSSAYQYRVIVVENSDVNALTFPGGHIVIFSGLVEMADTPEELASVIAHEIGHVEEHHVVKKIIKTLGLEILMGAATGGDDLLVSEILKTAASIVFDRHQEREADTFAMDLLVKAGINPRVMASFFRKVQERSSELETKLEMLSNHPENQSRIRAALQYQIPPDTEFVPFEIDWPKVVRSVSGSESDEVVEQLEQ
ncbi:MAG: M48 family metallopeptidase [Deltaproteobacteria bacterium]|nr:M48 family metallopeptidase [Deltaproteobacteria bacterium]